MNTVCFVVQSHYDFDPRVRRKAEALIAAGYSVDVLALRTAGGPRSYNLNGVNVRTISIGKNRGSLARYLFEYSTFFLWSLLRLSWQMLRRKYCVIDVNSLPDFLVFAAVPVRWMGAKLILDLHEITPEFYMSKYGIPKDSWIIRLQMLLEKFSVACADRVITINLPIEDLLVSRGLERSKAFIVMNSVDENRFAKYLRDSPASPDPVKFVMMYHGTLTPVYGLDTAINAFARVRDKMPGAELWILGSGTEKESLEKLASDRGIASKVRFVGQVPAADIPSWLNKCDVGILPIRRDVFLDYAFPNKLPEFIIMGKTVIISRLKAIEYYFDDDALAFFESDNPEGLAQQMIRLYGDRDLCVSLTKRAKEQYMPIRWELMKQRYLAIVTDLAAARLTTGEASQPPEVGS